MELVPLEEKLAELASSISTKPGLHNTAFCNQDANLMAINDQHINFGHLNLQNCEQ